jgi:hypothetical protein
MVVRCVSLALPASPMRPPSVNSLRRDLLLPRGPPLGPGSAAKLAFPYEMSENVLLIMKLVKVLALGEASLGDSLWPLARIPNNEQNYVRIFIVTL